MCQLLGMNCNVPTEPRDRVAVIATAPLTDNEAWTAISPGHLVAVRNGAPLEP